MTARSEPLLQHIRRLVFRHSEELVPDAALLDRFVGRSDEDAFAALVARHGPMVLGVCRRVLGNAHEAEDAAQAVFLVLARQAARIRRGQTLASWLHQTAHHLALKCLRTDIRRRRRERRGVSPSPQPDPLDELSAREWLAILDEELRRLPERYRLPLLLCYLEGRTHEEAARQLGWTAGSVQSRLRRGRAKLHSQLVKRGLALSAVPFALATVQAAPMPADFLAAALRAASDGKVAAEVMALAEEGLGSLAAIKAKVMAALLLAAGLAIAAGTLAHEMSAARPPAKAAPANAEASRAGPPTEKPHQRTDPHGDPLPDGALARLGTVRWRHGYVSALAYSPDGKKIAADGGGVTFWDVASGKLVQKLHQNGSYTSHIAFSPDGTMLATGDMKVCHLWNVATGKKLRQLKGDQAYYVDSVAFAPDGKTIAGADHGGTLHLWETATGTQLRRIECKQGALRAVAFSPDGRRLASGGSDGSICLWDPHTGKELRRLKAHPWLVFEILFSPDGKRLLSSGFGHNGTICEWDAATGLRIRAFGEKRRSKSKRHPIALSTDGRLLASGEGDGQICLWDMATGQEKRHWSVGPMPLGRVTFSPDGKTLASAAEGDSSIHLWDVATGRERHPSQEHIGPIHILRYSPDGKTLISVSPDRRMLWWDLAEHLPRHQFSWSAPGEGIGVALTLDGNTLAVESGPDRSFQLQLRDAGQLQLWDVRTGKLGLQLSKEKRLWPIAFSPDGRLLASCVEDSRVMLWDVRDGKEVRQLKGIALPVRSLCFSPDSKALAVGLRNNNPNGAASERTLRMWDVANGKEKSSFNVHDTLLGLAFSPDGKVLAGSNGDQQDAFVHLWDVRTGAELGRHRVQRGSWCEAIAFSADGKLVASGEGRFPWTGDNSVHVWEAATGRLIRRFEGHRSGVGSVAFSPDGLTVASGGGDSTILLWDITGRRADGRWHGKRLTPRQLDACWTDLANEDAAKAYDAVWALVAAPEQAVPFLRKHLPPLPRPDAKTVARLIADLDSNDFRMREKAMDELSKLGDAAAYDLRQALESKPAPEVRRRLRTLLEQAHGWTPGRLRDHRALQTLEHIGTRSAHEVLRALAEGSPESLRTEEAKDVLRRLGQR